MTMATPSFHTVSQVDHITNRLATMKPSGASTAADGTRYGRGASGSCRRSAPTASGAPPYISTLTDTMSSMSFCQLGNGRNKMTPTIDDETTPTQGTRLGVTAWNTVGKYPLRDRP